MDRRYKLVLQRFAEDRGYSSSELTAGQEYHDRKHRISHPDGQFDKAGRFYPDEESKHLDRTRSPSRAWPLSLNKAARSPKHVGEYFGAQNTLNVTRICKLIEEFEEFKGIVGPLKSELSDENTSYEEIDMIYQRFATDLRPLLKPASKREDFLSEEVIYQREEEERQRRAGMPVTKPAERKRVINENKPVKPMKIACDLGFRAHTETGGWLTARHATKNGFLILKAKNGKNVALAFDAKLMFSEDAESAQQKDVIDLDQMRFTQDGMKQELQKAMEAYQ